MKGRIHISQETADFLVDAGKSQWVQKREEKVMAKAKGKGEPQTYWLDTRGSSIKTVSSHTAKSRDSSMGTLSDDLTTKTESSYSGYPGSDSFMDSSRDIMAESADYPKQGLLDDKTSRLIDWNVDVLLRSLGHVVARTQALCEKAETGSHCLSIVPGERDNHAASV